MVQKSEGFLRKTIEGEQVLHQSNLTATTDPLLTDDESKGYGVESIWINTVSEEIWILLNPTKDAAIWRRVADGILQDDHNTLTPFYNGAVLETVDIEVIEDPVSPGTVILQLQQDGGGDLTFRFDNTSIVLDCTSSVCQVDLVAGTDTDPQENYVYVIEAAGVLSLEANQTGFPTTIHSPIAKVFAQTVASIVIDGAHGVHAHTDHIVHDETSDGHLSDINEKLRGLPADWRSGAAATMTVDGAGNGHADTTLGNARQVHTHVMPIRDMAVGDPLFLINHFSVPYTRITNFSSITHDAEDNSLSNKYGVFVLWGVVNEKEKDCKLYLNLPEGVYNNSAAALSDDNKTAVNSIPSVFVGTGFLIAEFVMKRASGGNWTVSRTKDLRGEKPSTVLGGGLGETNTASNVNSGGVGVFNQKTDANLEFRGINNVASETSVTDDSGNNEIDVGLADNARLPGTGGFVPPTGTTAQRPGSPINGQTRWNTTLGVKEHWDGSAWVTGGGGGGGGVFEIFYAQAASAGNGPTDDAGTTTNESRITRRLDNAEFLIYPCMLSPDYGGNGLTFKIQAYNTVTSGNSGYKVYIERERTDTPFHDITGASSFAAAISSTPITVPGTAGFIQVHTVTLTNSEIDGLLLDEGFRVKFEYEEGTASGSFSHFQKAWMVETP